MKGNEISNQQIPLKGSIIGDGFTDPYSTLAMMGSFGYSMGLIDF